MNSRTELYLAALARAGVGGTDQYRKKLDDNAPVPMNLEDLYCEGRVALIFAAYGWNVTMRPESNVPEPDLEACLNDGLLYIEVKHLPKQEAGPSAGTRSCAGDASTATRNSGRRGRAAMGADVQAGH